jgi:hypothetical protein
LDPTKRINKNFTSDNEEHPFVEYQTSPYLEQSPSTKFFAFTAQISREREDWMLDKNLFDYLDRRFGPHDVDACADPLGNNSRVRIKHWSKEDDCFNKDWSHYNIWCNPPWSLSDRIIQHYLLHVDMCGLTLVVPKWTWAPWYPKLVKYFHIVEFYQTGSQLFTAPPREGQQRLTIGPTRWQILVCRGKQSFEIDDCVSEQEWSMPYCPALVDHDPSRKEQIIQLGNKNEENLDSQSKTLLQATINEFQDIIAWSEEDVSRTYITASPIMTGDNPPLKQRSYRLSQKKEKIVQKEVDKWLKLGIVEKSQSPWSSPIVLVPKKPLDPNDPLEEKRHRLCVDNRKLNAITKSDSFPLPVMQDALDSLKQSEFFSIIDVRSAFLQLPLLPADKEKEETAFTIRSGLYEFNTLPLGLKNSPAVFQRLMHRVLGDSLYQSCMVYLDDIIVFSTDFESHMEDLRQIFGRLRQYRLKIHPEKTTLATSSVIYLGHLCTSEGVLPDPAKLEAVQTIPPPTSVTEVRSFLGLIGYYRRFIHGFSAIAEPLHALLHKDYAWVWTTLQQEAFETLRDRLLTAPILNRPDYDRDFILQIDWSGIAFGAILAQQHDDGQEQVVAYWSRSLNSAELNYSASEGEAMAAVKAIQHFRPYLHGRRFQLQNDHVALKWLMTTTNLQGKFARWALSLQEYDFDVLYKKGTANANADALSRLPNANNLRHGNTKEKISGCSQNYFEYYGRPLLRLQLRADICDTEYRSYIKY